MSSLLKYQKRLTLFHTVSQFAYTNVSQKVFRETQGSVEVKIRVPQKKICDNKK
jgi:hypothetical protein